ncbi:MAG: hypothetical protein AAGA23_11790 [Pseudomonadota bacterium]
MRRWILIGVLSGSIAAAFTLLWLDRQQDSSAPQGDSSAAAAPQDESVANAEAEAPKPAAPNQGLAKEATGRQQPTEAQAAAVQEQRLSLEERVVTEPDLPLSQTQAAAEWSHDDYAAATASVDQIDGETAFAAYEFARSCVGEPRSDQQFEFRLEQYNQYFDDNRRRVSENRLNRAMDRLTNEFVRCEPFADDDLVRTAADWLMLSADLDYLPAQVRFYNELPALLRETQARVFAEPFYLDLHREKSIDYLDRALLTGHPRAFLAMGIAIMDAVIFEADTQGALAYLEAADLAAHGLDPQIGELKARLTQELTPAEQLDAALWGADLCRRYCRLQDPDSVL